MKLEQVSLYSYRLRLRQAVQWSDVAETHADYVLLRLMSRDGAVGYAEATTKPTWSGYTAPLLVETLRELFLPRLLAADLSEPASLARALRLIPGHAQARGLVESALWMLQRAAASLDTTIDVPLSCTLTREAPPRMAEKALQWHDALGVNCFKFKGGQDMPTDLQAVRALRRALPAATLYVDANSAYDAASLTAYSAALAEHGVAWLEDPCPFTPGGFAQLARASRLPLLVDLAAADAPLAAHYAAAGAGAISAKPGRYGIPEALQVAAAAGAAGKPVCIGLFGESDLGSALSLAIWEHLPAARVALPAEPSYFLGLQEQLLRRPLQVCDGVLRLNASPLVDDDIDFSRMQNHACLQPG